VLPRQIPNAPPAAQLPTARRQHLHRSLSIRIKRARGAVLDRCRPAVRRVVHQAAVAVKATLAGLSPDRQLTAGGLRPGRRWWQRRPVLTKPRHAHWLPVAAAGPVVTLPATRTLWTVASGACSGMFQAERSGTESGTGQNLGQHSVSHPLVPLFHLFIEKYSYIERSP
jgi:hypothetical protein